MLFEIRFYKVMGLIKKEEDVGPGNRLQSKRKGIPLTAMKGDSWMAFGYRYVPQKDILLSDRPRI